MRHSVPPVSAMFPDRPPTWAEMLYAVVMGVIAGLSFVPASLPGAWPAFLAGVVAFGAFAWLAHSSLGERADERIDALGLGGKLVLLVVLVAVVAAPTVIVPAETFDGFAAGGLTGTVLYYLAYAVLAGEISGWWARRV